jgi:NAD(P)H-hydrate repair Nnr-like enzyme with NAD(P)H-hydrate dehydratase domain
MFQAACSAAFLNGYIGEYCKNTIGQRFTAMDIVQKINDAILDVIKK